MLLTGKVALVTGGGSGLGRATCMALAAEGAAVAVADIDRDRAISTVAAITQKNAPSIPLAGNVAVESDAQRFIDDTLKAFGRLDILDNNAGIAGEQQIASFVSEDLQRVFGVNIFGILFMCKHAIPRMAEGGGGSIVNIASAVALRARPGMPLYIASKGAVVAVTRALALDCAPLGIRVNCICPAAHDTPMLREHYDRLGNADELKAKNLRAVPLRRIGHPEDVANAVVFLASDRSSYITGHTLVLDGGQLAGTVEH